MVRPLAESLPRVILITDWRRGAASVLEPLQSVLPLGPKIAVHHRHPEASTRDFWNEARLLAEATARWNVPLFINGRLDVALLLNAHLHLPSSGMRVGDARAHLPRDRWISCAVHSPAEAEDRREADLALVSPVFAPGSKPDDTRKPLGVEGFHALAFLCDMPVYALGGVQPQSVAQLRKPLGRQRLAGVATQTGVLGSPHPREAAEALLAVLD